MRQPTLLLIHGLAGSLDYVDPSFRIANADVRALDLLGYGGLRGVSDDRLTLRGQAEHVAYHLETHCQTPAWLLGHSMGGAVAMLVTDQRPELVQGIINVEGNFTLKDAFWASKIIIKSPGEWAEEYRQMVQDVPATVAAWHIEPCPQRIEWLTRILAFQPPRTVYAMSRAIIAETGDPGYLEMARRVVESGMAIHLIAGARSATAWDVPDFVRAAARSYTEIADAGHLMMLEQPAAFCRTVDSILAST
jgi:pimeloyl-ACP methyl ester carboxylesterase